MIVYRQIVIGVMMLMTSLALCAQPMKPASAHKASADSQVPSAIRKDIVTRLREAKPDLRFGEINTTPIDGLYSLQVINGPTLYTTADGGHFVLGDLFQVTPVGYVNLAEKAREKGRAEQMATLAVKDMIVFAPEKKPAKASIMVFTDVDCYYCQKLHQEVPDLNEIGIEVRYLAYPRAGIGSASYRKIASAWCADDQQTAMTRLKNRQPIPEKVCKDNPVETHFKLGAEVGVTGTPAMVTEQGQLMPGYMPALQLAKALGVAVEPKLAAKLQAKMAAQGKK